MLILEQFWGDGISKREIRTVYTTAADANAACQDYLLRTWSRDQFSLYEIGASPQRPELSKVSAQINTDRFHVWVERHSWEGTLDFSTKAIAKRAGKGPNAYILQRTIKDASGGKRRSTTRGIFATYQLAKQALAQEQPPSEWSSNEGYVVETHGEYAHALSPSGKTAWLFIEIRPLYMTYQPMDQEEQEQLHAGGASSSSDIGASASHPISLDHGEDGNSVTGTPVASIPSSPSTFGFGLHRSSSLRPFHLDNPSSPMQSNPDEAGAFVYLVLQLKTIPFTPPILTVEAVAYEVEVANRVGITLLESFGGPAHVFEPIFREDGCLQGTIELRSRDEGLTVWVEKRAVVLGELDLELSSEPGSIPSTTHKLPHSPLRTHFERDMISTPSSALGLGSHKREEPEGGFDAVLPAPQTKIARISRNLAGRFKVVETIHSTLSTIATSTTATSTEATTTATEDLHRVIVESSEEVKAAVLKARVRFYHSVTNYELDSVEIHDELEKDDVRTILAKPRSNPSLVLLEVKVQEGPASE